MTQPKLIAIALAALLVFAGTAAAASHGDVPTEADANATAADENAPVDPGSDADASRDENATTAPPTEMPENASDQVSEIHALIQEKICGCLSGQELGAEISALAGNDDRAAEASGDATVSPDEAGTQDQADAADAQSEADDQSANADQAGPAGDIPEQAVDQVSAIQDAISSFLSSDGDGNLGDTVSGIVGGGSTQG